jgi:hypothetical protein
MHSIAIIIVLVVSVLILKSLIGVGTVEMVRVKADQD